MKRKHLQSKYQSVKLEISFEDKTRTIRVMDPSKNVNNRVEVVRDWKFSQGALSFLKIW